MQVAGLSDYLGMASGERYDDLDTLHPPLILGGSGEAGKTGEAVQALAVWLQSPPLADTAALRVFLTERKSALCAQYSDPYYYECSMMLQASTQPNRFMNSIPAGFVGASMLYKDFIDAAETAPDGDAALLMRMRVLLDGALYRTGVAAEFTSSRADYSDFRQAAETCIAALPAGTGASSCEWLPQGWPSALVLSSNTRASNHVMLVGAFGKKPDNMADSLADQNTAEHLKLARFVGVSPDSAQANTLAKLYDRGLLNGYADGSYRPQEKITRAEFCVIASALAKDNSKAGGQSFRDVPDGHWAHDVIAGMAAQGILKGYGDGTFRPEAPITHQQSVLILQRLANA